MPQDPVPTHDIRTPKAGAQESGFNNQLTAAKMLLLSSKLHTTGISHYFSSFPLSPQYP